MESTTIAVDLAKSVFEVAISHETGRVASRHRLSRGQFQRFLALQKPAVVVMEACGTGHFWGRQARAHGHRVMLLPPHAVRPYVHGNKTDAADAKGLLEAARNESIAAVPVKSVEQQVLTSLHRDANRAAESAAWAAPRARNCDSDGCTPGRSACRSRPLRCRLGSTRASPTELVRGDTRDPGARGEDPGSGRLRRGVALLRRLRTIPGVGLLTATALAAFVGDVARFRSGRKLASYLGLTPREWSSGTQRKRGRISKRGDPYIRMLLIHGARSVLLAAKKNKHPDRLRSWALDRERVRGHNKATVALANKLARIVWAVWHRQQDYAAAVAP